MGDLGRLLIGLGLLIAAIGVAVLLVGKMGLPLGRLPGDFAWRGKHTTVYFPLRDLHRCQRCAVADLLDPLPPGPLITPADLRCCSTAPRVP